MSYFIFPTSENVTSVTDYGNRLREGYVTQQLNHASGHRGGVVRGCTVTNPSGLTVSVAAGELIIRGYRVYFDAAVSITATDDAWSYQHIRLNFSASRATSLEGVSLTAPSLDPTYVLISKTNASSGVITYLDDERQFIRSSRSDTYAGDGTTSRNIDTDFATNDRTPCIVIGSTADSTTTDRIFCISEINAPGNKLVPNSYYPRARLWFEEKPEKFVPVYKEGYGRIDDGPFGYYNPGTLTIDCPGARVGDFVSVRLDPILTTTSGAYVSAQVIEADTVKVWLKSLAAGGTTFHHDIFVTVYISSTFSNEIGESEMHFLSGTDLTTDKSPYIDVDGFVTSGGTSQSMNASGRQYNYVSFFG